MRVLIAWLLLAGVAAADEDKDVKKAQAYLKAGVARLEGGKNKEALQSFKKGLEHKPLPELHYRAGQAYQALGDDAAAGKEYRAYLAAAPGAPERAELERYLGGGGAAPPPQLRGATALTAAPPPVQEKCSVGKFATIGTSGHCCWREQVWSDGKGKCVGVPRCPAGFALRDDDCVREADLPRCPAGKVPAGGHCCWREQAWSEEKGRCTGTPRGPRGWTLEGRECEPPSEDDED
jgi:tetratricopeptide (TPR) repeat protein